MAISTELWKTYGNLSTAAVPADVWTWTKHCVFDWYGVTLTGSTEPLSQLLRAEYDDNAGRSAIVGRQGRADVRTAALLNGAAAHAIDFDDSNASGGGHHPAAVTVAGALAVAQELGSTGQELLTAVLSGYEFSWRIGAAMGGNLFTKGWHPTSAVGVFGSLAAAASLMHLDEEEFGNAFGIAASLAAGVQANFGTMTKPLHAGLAAQSGITAARLGRRGITANAEALESMAGLAELMGDGVHQELVDALDGEWIVRRNIFKFSASCLGTHASIQAARKAIDGARDLSVGSVLVRVNPISQRICRFDYPDNGLQAKFSVRATTAMTLLGDNTGDPATFSDSRVHDADFLDMMARIEVRADPDVARQNSYVAIQTTDGAQLDGHADSSIPSSDLVAQEANLREKFIALASPVLGTSASATADRLLRLDAEPDVNWLD
ncbi:MAG: 2-methylcitrate dehydratase [Microbacteriaceae bacterium]|jgi:2-methylcitrate dehydratase PrpD|nr:2-methylcitrate dehydratase [Microbacteriaceae bacterium]